MCDPITIAATVASVAATSFNGVQAAGQARYQAKVAERNAALAREQGQQALEIGGQQNRDIQRRNAQLLGAKRAAAAANGIDPDFGSAAQVQSDGRMLGREDVGRNWQNAHDQLRSFDISASNDAGEAKARRSAATGALIQSGLESVSTVLSKASQFQGAPSARKVPQVPRVPKKAMQPSYDFGFG